MILSVDPALPLPASEQIRQQVSRMVAAGTLEAGHRLPTIRQLAADLGLAKGTVARAYELLESEAVIETRGRRGSFIRPGRALPAEDRDRELTEAAEALIVVARQLGVGPDEVHAALDRAWARF